MNGWRALKGREDHLVVVLDAGHRRDCRVLIVRTRVELEIADMRNEGEVGGVERIEHALVFALLHLGVGHVADEGEVEGAVLGANASTGQHQGRQQQRAWNEASQEGAPGENLLAT